MWWWWRFLSMQCGGWQVAWVGREPLSFVANNIEMAERGIFTYAVPWIDTPRSRWDRTLLDSNGLLYVLAQCGWVGGVEQQQQKNERWISNKQHLEVGTASLKGRSIYFWIVAMYWVVWYASASSWPYLCNWIPHKHNNGYSRFQYTDVIHTSR